MVCDALQSHPYIHIGHETYHPWKGTYDELFADMEWKFPYKKHFIIHTQIDHGMAHSGPSILDAPYPKMGLWLKDYVLGAAAQCMLNYQRADGCFELDTGIVADAVRLRKERDEVLKSKVDMLWELEEMRQGKMLSSIPEKYAQAFYDFVGEPIYKELHVRNINKHPLLALPQNMDEIRDACKNI